MQTIIIDEEFKHLMPVLDKETYALLEENILENGCRDALVLWEGILIDGHNRYSICTKHDIPFDTVNKEFSSREEALIWIIANQVSRRNLTPIQLSHFRGLHYRADKKLVTNKSGKNQYGEVVGHNDQQPKVEHTGTRLGKQYGVSPKTIFRDSKLADAIDAIGEVSPEAKTKILSSEVKIEKKALEGLASASKDEIAEVAARIEDGTYEKVKPEPASDADSPGRYIGSSSVEGFVSAQNRQEDILIDNITGTLYQELLRACRGGNSVQKKKALRAYIDTLEGLYEKL